MGKFDSKFIGYVIECDCYGHSGYVENITIEGFITTTFYAEDAFIFPELESAMDVLISSYLTDGNIKARYALQITQFMDIDT